MPSQSPAATAKHFAIRPLNQVYCGCSIVFGVYSVILIQLFASAVVLISVIGDIVFDDPQWKWFATDYATQAFFGTVSFLGVPIIIAGFLGTWYRHEVLLRIYWFYMVACFIVLFCWEVDKIILSNPCAHISSIFSRDSDAFTCGMMRGLHVLCFLIFTLVPLYWLFMVHSFCTDLGRGDCTTLNDLNPETKISTVAMRWVKENTVGNSYGALAAMRSSA